MKLQAITRYQIDGAEFETVMEAKNHIEERIFEHIRRGTVLAGHGVEQAKLRLDLTAYLLDNAADIAALLTADLNPESDE